MLPPLTIETGGLSIVLWTFSTRVFAAGRDEVHA